MTGFIACLAGLLGMLGLWSLAWWLWRQDALPPSTADRRRRPGWPSDPIPKRTPSIPPPSWVFAPVGVEPDPLDLDDAPAARERPSSSANTSRYLRAERTEVLADSPRFDGEQPALESTDPTSKIGGRTRKIGLISLPGPLTDE